jgi:hypothetical protein
MRAVSWRECPNLLLVGGLLIVGREEGGEIFELRILIWLAYAASGIDAASSFRGLCVLMVSQ